ncbi:MAG: hypothetical protein AAFQ40_00765 [Cyanobacteria bacterium J06623_5]
MLDDISTWQVLWKNSKRRRYIYLGLSLTLLVAIVQPTLIGQIYSEAQAINLLKGLQSSSLYFGSAIATASATVLALMLTLLSMTNRLEAQFERSVYDGIRLVGFISTVTFITSVILLLCLSLPVGEFEQLPPGWFKGLYYILSTLNGFLSSLMIVGVLILFDTIKTLIKKLSP